MKDNYRKNSKKQVRSWPHRPALKGRCEWIKPAQPYLRGRLTLNLVAADVSPRTLIKRKTSANWRRRLRVEISVGAFLPRRESRNFYRTLGPWTVGETPSSP